MNKIYAACLVAILFMMQSCDTKIKQAKHSGRDTVDNQQSMAQQNFPNRLNIPIPTDEVVDEFYEAIFANDNTKARKMLETTFPANYEPKNKIRPLEAVISTSDNLYLARLLVEGGANITQTENPLVVRCAEYGRLGILKYLVERKVNINNNEAFNKAGFYQFYDCAKFLLLNGANQEKGDVGGKLWFFEQAVNKFDYEVLDALNLSKADLDNNNCDGETAVIIAVKKNNLKMVSYLIKKGADKGKKETFDCGDDIHYGKTPLKIAMDNKYEDIVQLIRGS